MGRLILGCMGELRLCFPGKTCPIALSKGGVRIGRVWFIRVEGGQLGRVREYDSR